MQFNAQESGFTVSFNDDAGPRADAPAGTPGRPFAQRRRNRHGRGLRGPLLLPGLPGARSRSEKFEDLVVDSAERLRELWVGVLEDVEYLVEEVPDNLEALVASGAQAPLGKYSPAVKGAAGSTTEQAVIVIYRHPVEALCDAPWQVRELVHEVLIEQVAGLLNIDPDTVDPLFRRFRGH